MKYLVLIKKFQYLIIFKVVSKDEIDTNFTSANKNFDYLMNYSPKFPVGTGKHLVPTVTDSL